MSTAIADLIKQGDALAATCQWQQAIKHIGDVSNDAEGLARLARWTGDSTEADHTQPSASRAASHKESVVYAERAVKLDTNCANAWKALAISKAKLAEHVGTDEKIKISKEVKEAIEEAIRLNPNDSTSWHVLGCWHLNVSRIGKIQKFAIKIVYGKLPEASLEKALECLKMALECNENATSHVQVGKVLQLMGNHNEAQKHFALAMDMPNNLEVYRKSIDEARRLSSESSRRSSVSKE